MAKLLAIVLLVAQAAPTHGRARRKLSRIEVDRLIASYRMTRKKSAAVVDIDGRQSTLPPLFYTDRPTPRPREPGPRAVFLSYDSRRGAVQCLILLKRSKEWPTSRYLTWLAAESRRRLKRRLRFAYAPKAFALYLVRSLPGPMDQRAFNAGVRDTEHRAQLLVDEVLPEVERKIKAGAAPPTGARAPKLRRLLD